MRMLPAALLVILLAASASAQGAASQNCAALFDAAGTRVGRVHGGSPTWIYFAANQLAALLQVAPAGDELRGTATTLYFTEPDIEPLCESAPFLAAPGASAAWLQTAVLDRTLYVQDPAVPAEPVLAKSTLNTDTGVCRLVTQNVALAPALTFVDALPASVPPYRVEPEACFVGATAPAISIPERIALTLVVAAVGAWMLRGRRPAAPRAV